MLKRILPFFILSIFLAHFAGFYIYFFTQLQVVRQEMRAKLKELPPEELELIVLSSAEYQHAKVEDHEIKVEGKMYDVARVEKVGDRVLIYCVHDEAEDSLMAFLDKILSLPLKDKGVPTGVLQFFSLNYLPVHWNFSTPQFYTSPSFTFYSEIHSQYIFAKVVPPPKV